MMLKRNEAQLPTMDPHASPSSPCSDLPPPSRRRTRLAACIAVSMLVVCFFQARIQLIYLPVESIMHDIIVDKTNPEPDHQGSSSGRVPTVIEVSESIDEDLLPSTLVRYMKRTTKVMKAAASAVSAEAVDSSDSTDRALLNKSDSGNNSDPNEVEAEGEIEAEDNVEIEEEAEGIEVRITPESVEESMGSVKSSLNLPLLSTVENVQKQYSPGLASGANIKIVKSEAFVDTDEKKKATKNDVLEADQENDVNPDGSTDTAVSVNAVQDGNVQDGKDLCKPLQPLQWEFEHYHNHTAGKEHDDNKGDQKRHGSKQLLIGMYSGFDSYSRLLDITATVNKAYAKRWGQSTVVLQGVAMHLDHVDGHNCTPKAGVRAAFNKIRLLQYALDHTDRYDQLLLVDTDAMMYDLDFDVTTMVDDDDVMLVAHRVREEEPERGSWNVNNGVTLWNLHHSQTAGVVADWDRFARQHIEASGGFGGDQHQMHRAIKRGSSKHAAERIAGIKAVYGPFIYGHGSVIRHYIRDAKSWTVPNPLENRIKHLDHAREKVCAMYESDVCGSIDQISYGDRVDGTADTK